MVGRPEAIGRRKMFRTVALSGIVAATGVATVKLVAADEPARTDKRRPRYRADSAEVKEFYRVNRYPAT